MLSIIATISQEQTTLLPTLPLITICIILISSSYFFFQLLLKCTITIAFTQNLICYSSIEQWVSNKPALLNSTLYVLFAKIYYHSRFFAQKHCQLSKKVFHTPPDWSSYGFPPTRTKTIVFLRHSTSSLNRIKRKNKTLTPVRRLWNTFKRCLLELRLLPSTSTIYLDPPLAKRGIYQAIKFNRFLQTFLTQSDPKQSQFSSPPTPIALNYDHPSVNSNPTPLYPSSSPLSAFNNRLHHIPDYITRQRAQITSPSQERIVNILNDTDMAAKNNTLLVSSQHKRALSTISIALKNRLNKNKNEKIYIHSALASFAPTLPKNIPNLEDCPIITDLIVRDGTPIISPQLNHTNINNNMSQSPQPQATTIQSPPTQATTKKYHAEDIFDATYNAGSTALNKTAMPAILSFVNWLSKRPEDNIIICGHSTWLLYFLRLLLPQNFNHVSKCQKLKNTSCIAFDLHIADNFPRDQYNDIISKYGVSQIYNAIDEPLNISSPNDNNDSNSNNTISPTITPNQLPNNSNKANTGDGVQTVQWIDPKSFRIIYKGFDKAKYYQLQLQPQPPSSLGDSSTANSNSNKEINNNNNQTDSSNGHHETTSPTTTTLPPPLLLSSSLPPPSTISATTDMNINSSEQTPLFYPFLQHHIESSQPKQVFPPTSNQTHNTTNTSKHKRSLTIHDSSSTLGDIDLTTSNYTSSNTSSNNSPTSTTTTTSCDCGEGCDNKMSYRAHHLDQLAQLKSACSSPLASHLDYNHHNHHQRLQPSSQHQHDQSTNSQHISTTTTARHDEDDEYHHYLDHDHLFHDDSTDQSSNFSHSMSQLSVLSHRSSVLSGNDL